MASLCTALDLSRWRGPIMQPVTCPSWEWGSDLIHDCSVPDVSLGCRIGKGNSLYSHCFLKNMRKILEEINSQINKIK